MAIIDEAIKGCQLTKSKSYMEMMPEFKSIEDRSDVSDFLKSALVHEIKIPNKSEQVSRKRLKKT